MEKTVRDRKNMAKGIAGCMNLTLLQEWRTIGYDDNVWCLSAIEPNKQTLVNFYVDSENEFVEIDVSEKNKNRARLFVSLPVPLADIPEWKEG